MRRFQRGEIDVLVATTVVEVVSMCPTDGDGGGHGSDSPAHVAPVARDAWAARGEKLLH